MVNNDYLKWKALNALCVPEEIAEVKTILSIPQGPIKLRRTFNQKDFKGGFIRFWRVLTKGHPRYESDLSFDGLREAGIV